MVSKLISAVISFFRLRLRQASQKDFHRSSTAPQIFLLAFLVSPEKIEISRRKSFETISIGFLIVMTLKPRHKRFKSFKPSRGFYWALTFGITILAVVTGGFFYYQYLVRQIHQLPLYDFKFPESAQKTLPPIPQTITEEPFRAPLLGSSFTDLFSGTGWLDSEKTTLYQDFSMTQFSFPPKFEWQRVPDMLGGSPSAGGLQHFVRLEEEGTDRRCIGDQCLIQKELELFLNNVVRLNLTTLPVELRTPNLLNISIGSTDTFWLLGGVVKDKDNYRGLVFKFDGKEFTKIFNDNDFLSSYPGVLGFGGSADNWLAIYGAYEGIAWQAVEKSGIVYFHNISRFFPIRVMGESVTLKGAKERFVSFRPEAIKDGKNWYVYSLTEDKPKFIKLVEDSEEKISAAWDLTKNLELDQGVKSAIFVVEKPWTLLANVVRFNLTTFWRFRDLGFDKSKSLEAVSANINNLPGQVVSARISDADPTKFTKSDFVRFWLSNDGEVWYSVEPKQTLKFPKAGNKVFWKATFAPDQDPATSPVLNRLQLEYQVRL